MRGNLCLFPARVGPSHIWPARLRHVVCLTALLASLLLPAALVGQDKISTVTIVTEHVNRTITDAQILVNEESSLRKIGTSWQVPNWVPYEGIDVTDPVAPPDGFKIKSTTVKWSSIKQIDFLGCEQWDRCKGTVTMRSGESRGVFVWRDSYLNMREGLAPDHVKIVGRMLVDGQLRDVEFQDTDSWLRLIIR